LILNEENIGLHASFKKFMEEAGDYDYYMKIDNDCLILCPDMIKNLVKMSKAINDHFILSPRVEGIFKQPDRTAQMQLDGHTIGLVAAVGGICMFMPQKIMRGYHHNLNAPKHRGLDSAICANAIRKKFNIAYVEDMSVMHTENTMGQQLRYSQYFLDKKE
jgi:hypothetical protein